MLIYQGEFSVGQPTADNSRLVKIQLWTTHTSFAFENPKLEFETFVRPDLVPLESIRGPSLQVYSDDNSTIDFFSQVCSSKLGLLVACENPQFDHLVFYFEDTAVMVRPLVLNTRPVLPRPLVEPEAKPDRTLQQVVLGALRIRGYSRKDPDFKKLYQLCCQAVEFSLRNHKDASVAIINEKVEAILNVLE